jgi:hypothetical protein
METFEYSLQLGTGEAIAITEISLKALDDWARKAFDDAKSSKAIAGVVGLCSKIPHQIMEDAKIGYTKPLEHLLRIPSIGALTKLDRPRCSNISECAMADERKCTTRHLSTSGKFPECWDYSLAGQDEEFTDSMAAAQEIAKVIVMAWRDGRYVIISE